jgi:hypothetical protein
MNVSPERPNFNHTRISVALSIIGVEYTMADKSATSVPYISIDEVSFLKRKWIYNEELKCHMAPLEPSSFNKMLTAYVDNGTLAPEAHSIIVIETAIREYFFYGRETFEERLTYFKNIVKLANLEMWVRDSTFPSYDQLIADFKDRSRGIALYKQSMFKNG